MNIQLISRSQLEIINRKTLRYPLHIAEKDYFLALAMQIIYSSALGKILIFKGGTAINHCYLDQYRFSEDLDFSSNETSISIGDIREAFSPFPLFTIKKEYRSEATIKVERLQYSGVLSQPNSMKIEVDYFQNVLLPPKSVNYKNVWGLEFSVCVMDEREIAAEKIRAMSDRARYRDFYDLYWLAGKYKLDMNEVVSLIARKEIREPIAKAKIITNWGVVGTQKTAEMNQVFYSQGVDDKQLTKMIDDLPLTEIV
jgi:predicted nucleotidyltransferase component of viral defense system